MGRTAERAVPWGFPTVSKPPEREALGQGRLPLMNCYSPFFCKRISLPKKGITWYSPSMREAVWGE